MTLKIGMLYTIFLLLGFFHVKHAANSCQSAEEHKPHTITCSFNVSKETDSSIRWSAGNNTVLTCSSDRCNKAANYEAIVYKNTSTLTIHNVSRIHETKWSCIDGQYVCAPLKVFAKPRSLNCHVTFINSTTSMVEIRCIAERLYPTSFSMEILEGQGNDLLTYGSYCTYPARKEIPVYYTLNCTTSFHSSKLRIGRNYVKARVYPKFHDGMSYIKYSVESAVIVVVKDVRVESTVTGDHLDEVSPTEDKSVIIGLGALATTAVCAAIVLGALVVCRGRKPKSNRNRAVELLLDEIVQNMTTSPGYENSTVRPVGSFPNGYDCPGDTSECADEAQLYEEVCNISQCPTQPQLSGPTKSEVYENIYGTNRDVVIQEITAFLNKYINDRNREQKHPF